jgi:hypothetical protein
MDMTVQSAKAAAPSAPSEVLPSEPPAEPVEPSKPSSVIDRMFKMEEYYDKLREYRNKLREYENKLKEYDDLKLEWDNYDALRKTYEQYINVYSETPVLRATASEGDISITTPRSLALDQARAVGQVKLNVGGDLTDANDIVIRDQADIDRLLALWKRLGVMALDENGQAAESLDQAQGQIAAKRELLAEQIGAMYHQYWQMVNNHLAADPGSNQAGAEAALSARDDSFRNLAHILRTFDAALLSRPYDSGFAPTVSNLTAEQAARLESRMGGAVILKADLVSLIDATLAEATTTTLTLEAANIIGRSATIVATGNVGSPTRDTDGDGFAYKVIRGYTDKAAKDSFTEEELLLILASESTDRYLVENIQVVIKEPFGGREVTIQGVGINLPNGKKLFATADGCLIMDNGDRLQVEVGDMIIRENDDINVKLTGTGGRLDVYAGGHVLLGTGVLDVGRIGARENLTISAVQAGGELRIKADG